MTRARDVASQGGLVLLNTTTFSAQSTVSINNVFSSTYTNYKLLINLVPSASTTVNLRLRNLGTDNSANLYYTTGYESSSGGLSNRYNQQTFWWLSSNTTSATSYFYNVDLGNPALADFTLGSLSGQNFAYNTSNYQIFHYVQSSFDGMTVFPTSGTITGTIEVYGYK